jgi:thiamine biosynthesis lipoprotein
MADVRIELTDPRALPAARRLVAAQLSALDRTGSQLRKLHRSAGRPVRVNRLLAELVGVALTAARDSAGDVDPTLGSAMLRLGYGLDLSPLPACGGWRTHPVRPTPGWQRVRLDGRTVTVPPGVLLDLGATAKAYTADRCAELIARRYGVGALVSLGSDVATAGPAPEGGWRVAAGVRVPAGTALATSSASSHVLDPRTSQPVTPVWRSVSVLAPRCVTANTIAVSTVVRGTAALGWLRELGVPARLVSVDGKVYELGRVSGGGSLWRAPSAPPAQPAASRAG